jgi:hypothetical protein
MVAKGPAVQLHQEAPDTYGARLLPQADRDMAAADVEANRDLIDIFARGLSNPRVKRGTLRVRAATYGQAMGNRQQQTSLRRGDESYYS